jgi:hypothetical protein
VGGCCDCRKHSSCCNSSSSTIACWCMLVLRAFAVCNAALCLLTQQQLLLEAHAT